MGGKLTGKARTIDNALFGVLLAAAAVMVVFAVAAQPEWSLFSGFWDIQFGEAGLITDPVCTGGCGAALLNAAVLMVFSALLVRLLGLPFTGMAMACCFMMAGFALLGKNLINSTPILVGGCLYALYKREHFSKYLYLTLFGTCLAPLISFLMLYAKPGFRWLSMAVCGMIIGFILPSVSAYTVRIHQGYNLYNVGFAAGFVGLGAASVLKGFGVTFTTKGSWSTDCHLILSIFTAVILLGLAAAGAAMGCRSWDSYRRILHHSGRAVADFVLLDGPGVTLMNMGLTGAIGFLYLLAVEVPLNGPLVCCIFAMTGFGAFGKHPRNVVPVMTGAVLSALIMGNVPITAPGVLLATLLCTGLAPISGQFGWPWGVAAGFLHMAIVQNTAILHEGMNLYNNGFAAGFTCILLIPIIEAVKADPEV
ncbi:MAG: DUF1576 domain-containing protein [Oscillospiraceae bacterium]|jgi:hypothetical protein|nr:DUF1576 domain-containing protein [Oscillospiraceae bacterium]